MKRLRQYAVQYGKILLGSAFYAAGFEYFTYPNAIVSGGLTGISMILNLLFGLPVGATIIIINIPLFLVAWKKFGLGFIVSSLVGMALSSLLIDLFALFPAAATKEPLLAAVYGGLIMGFGLGIIYASGATTGGMDIVAKLLRRKFAYINFGTLMLVLDVVIIVTFAVVFRRYDSAMYAIICMFVIARVVDLVLYGPASSKLCYIISDKDKSDKVKNAIIGELNRGVTMLSGVGAYSGKERQVLLCVVKRQQIAEVRRIVRDIDLNAFLIITDARDVYGSGFRNISVVE